LAKRLSHDNHREADEKTIMMMNIIQYIDLKVFVTISVYLIQRKHKSELSPFAVPFYTMTVFKVLSKKPEK